MGSGSEKLHRRDAAWFTRSDWLILLAAAALGLIFIATGPVAPNGRFFILSACLICAIVIIGVKHVLAPMQRPFVALAWCLLGGVLGGALFFYLARAYVIAHSVQSHGEDYGAMAAGIFHIGLLIVAPVAGFLIGFPAALAICAAFLSKADEPKPSGRHPDRN
jgi:hypothetical protein